MQLAAILRGKLGLSAEEGVDGGDGAALDVLTAGGAPAVDGVAVEGAEAAQHGARAARDEHVVLQAVEALIQRQAGQVALFIGVEIADEGQGAAAHAGAVHLDGAAQRQQHGGGGARLAAGQRVALRDLGIGIGLRVVAVQQEAVGAQDHAVKVEIVFHIVYLRWVLALLYHTRGALPILF